ncbi:MAG TPA: MarR family winged helix-turn-helix transcriptional regulator [Hydrogenophaga sp.]|uniref:MarR family winged helix-turn-helix transcriptional regulator n=1 Tax=Hydrogenophaga sp. TaxID=1904254 RepID=UPI002CDADB2A|nr:MarR family winged helix-turn-helix transcriptional regulator [Hydrogenophaga sp.]HMN93809.1 MarR family winged helix-turn-helix transcriptional regulator [Hydrogenophaga sp.]HMP09668.1 MarR family winged helix-turn-helix transcriptional regulator [Hydrogenophaga sp.]
MTRSADSLPGTGAPGFVEDYLAYLLARASHRVSAEFHAEVAACGLSVPEWRVLASLAGGQERHVGELCDIVLAQQPTLTKLLGRMEAQGLVQRRTGIQDRRKTKVSLTPQGQKLVTPLLERARAHEARVLAEIGPLQGSELKLLLRRLIDPDDHRG